MCQLRGGITSLWASFDLLQVVETYNGRSLLVCEQYIGLTGFMPGVYSRVKEIGAGM